MEFLLELLINDGVSTALIIVLFFIWREISGISKRIDGFNAKLYRNGMPLFQSVEVCEKDMHACRNDLNNIGMKVHKNTNDIIRLEMRIATLAESKQKTGLNNQ